MSWRTRRSRHERRRVDEEARDEDGGEERDAVRPVSSTRRTTTYALTSPATVRTPVAAAKAHGAPPESHRNGWTKRIWPMRDMTLKLRISRVPVAQNRSATWR